jgi:hypothetical protein
MHNRELVSNAETKSSLSQHPEEGRQRIFEHPLLKLQRRYGNHFVQRVLALARKGDGETEVSPDIEQAIHQARSSGRALDSDVRTQMEPALGADFSGVRVHTNAQADKLNQALNARAFTTGQDIFFKQGEYRPGSSIGRELLAHELTHVVQQTGDAKCKLSIGQADDHYEQEADQIAHTVVRRERQSVSAYRGDHVCRQSDFREEEQGEEPYRAKLESPQVRQQKDSDEEDEKSVQAEAIGAGGQAVAHNQPINSLRAPDGRISLRIRRQLAPDQQTPDTGTVPGASPASMPEADRAAANIMDMYYRENILFDYWGGDCRDNNKNNRMDANDRAERNSADGAHYSGTYRGFRTLPGTCYGGEGGTVTTGDFEVDTPVKYRVCADVVSLAYSNAGLLSTTRRVHTTRLGTSSVATVRENDMVMLAWSC